MATVKSFILKVIDQRPEIIIGKNYDYKCKEHDDYYNIYRRVIDGAPWKLYVVVPKKTPEDTSTWART